MVPMQAMARGLGSRLQQPMFTTCGKIKVKVVKSKIDLKFAVKFEICGEIQDQFKICDPDQFKSGQFINCDIVQVPKYNNPRDLYGDAVMEEMISGSSVE